MSEPIINSLYDLFNKNPDTNYEYEIPFIVSNEHQKTTETPSLSESPIMYQARGDDKPIVKNDIIFVAYDVGLETKDILNQIYNYKICDHVSTTMDDSRKFYYYSYSAPSRNQSNKINPIKVPKFLIDKNNTTSTPYIYPGARTTKNNNAGYKVYDFIASNLVQRMYNSLSYDDSFKENDASKTYNNESRTCTLTDPILQGYRFDTSVIKEDKLRIVYITLYKVDDDRVNHSFKRHLMRKGDDYYSIKIKITSYTPDDTFTTQEFFLPPTLFALRDLRDYNGNDESFKLNCRDILKYIGLVFFLPIIKGKTEDIYETPTPIYDTKPPHFISSSSKHQTNYHNKNPMYQTGSLEFPLQPNQLYLQSNGTSIVDETPPPLPPRGKPPPPPVYARVKRELSKTGGYKPRKTKKHNRKYSKSTHKHVRNTIKK